MVFLPCTSKISSGVCVKVSVAALLARSSISSVVTPVPARSAGNSRLGTRSQRLPPAATEEVAPDTASPAPPNASRLGVTFPGTPDIPKPDDILEAAPLTESVTELNTSVTAPVASVITLSNAVEAAATS